MDLSGFQPNSYDTRNSTLSGRLVHRNNRTRGHPVPTVTTHVGTYRIPSLRFFRLRQGIFTSDNRIRRLGTNWHMLVANFTSFLKLHSWHNFLNRRRQFFVTGGDTKVTSVRLNRRRRSTTNYPLIQTSLTNVIGSQELTQCVRGFKRNYVSLPRRAKHA